MNPNLFWCIIGIIGGAIFSFVISLTFYHLGKTRKYLLYKIVKKSYLIKNDVNKIDNLEIKYNDIKINNLYKSEIIIRNIGNSIIEREDFSSSLPLSINASNFALSNKDFENKTYINKNNNVNWSLQLVEPNNFSQLYIDFDYIPKNGKISFSILHTDRIYIRGKLKDGDLRGESPHSTKIGFVKKD